MVPFEKVSNKDAAVSRFGPAAASEVIPLAKKHIKHRSVVISDRLRAYRERIHALGYGWLSANYSRGEFSRQEGEFAVHTNTIDGVWGQWKNILRGLKSVYADNLEAQVLLASQCYYCAKRGCV